MLEGLKYLACIEKQDYRVGRLLKWLTLARNKIAFESQIFVTRNFNRKIICYGERKKLARETLTVQASLCNVNYVTLPVVVTFEGS